MPDATPSAARSDRSVSEASADREATTLTASQRALWSSQRRYPDEPLQNMALLTHLDGQIDVGRLTEAFETVVQSSRTLRLTIDEAGSAAVLTRPPAPTQVIDLPRSAAQPWAAQRVLAPVDVGRAVYDSVVIRHNDGTVSWYLCLHHVATDATSSALVFQATARVYHGEVAGLEDLDLTPTAQSKRRQRAIDYWAAREKAPLLDSLYRPVVQRSTEVERSPVQGVPMQQIEQALDGSYAMISRDLAWTALLMSAVAIQLHRSSGADHFAIGLPVHNRSGAHRLNVVGPLMEVYPVDITIASDQTFADVHANVSKQLLTVVGFALPDVGAAATDVSAIVNVIPRGDLGRFGSTATSTEWIHPNAADPYHLLGAQLTTYGSARPDLFLDVNAGAADAQQRREAAEHFSLILQAMVEQPGMSIDGHSLLSESDQQRTRSWGTGAGLRPDRFALDPRTPRSTGSVLDRLSVALSNGSRTALIDQGEAMSGRTLWARAGTVAGNLAAAGVGQGDRVGVEMARSADAVVAILGVLRAGAAYVPIDPSHPEARRVRTGEQAGVVGVLTDLAGIDEAAPFDSASVPIAASDEAYVLFTSGSTGEPKGVPITHGGLADYLAFASQHYLGPKQRRPVAPLFTSLGFDLTVTSLFLPLIAGGTLVIIEEDGLAGLRSVAARSDLTWIKATPSHLELLARLVPPTHRLSTMVVGGEAFPRRLAHELTRGHPGLEVFNEYGPTEAVVGCMIHRFDPASAVGGDVPIGVPATGVSLRIVDRGGHDVPVGVAGELLISSAGLSPGYLGHVRDTGAFARFEGQRWYSSGDVVRIGSDGQAVYLGRVDDQIKLSGVRLEPAEVAAALEAHDGVARAVVRLWSPPSEGRPILAAWVEPSRRAGEVDAAELRAFLLSRLAPHQIPAAIAAVATLPFNANGKLDVAALPTPERIGLAGGDDALMGVGEPTADLVRATWARSLGLAADESTIGGADDFFVLGGDSLAALEMTSDLSASLGIEVSEGLVFAASTLGDFVAAVSALDGAEIPILGPVPIPGQPALSPGERALVFEHELSSDSPRYNIGRRYVVESSIDAGRLRHAFERVVERHEPLHTTFGNDRSVLSADRALSFSAPDVNGTASLSDDESRSAADALYRRPFDLENGPLVRVAVHELSGQTPRWAVVIVTHHISGDAGSLDRLWADLDTAYSGGELPPLSVSYSDHAVWQAGRDHGAAFWSELWSDPVITGLGLPGAVGAHEGGYVERPASFNAAALRSGPGRTPTATVLAALAALLDRQHRPGTDDRPGRYSIGLTASLREHVHSEPMVGYFLNTLPMVIEVEAEGASAQSLAGAASDALAAALPYRTHPFAEMVALARREQRQLPIPDVLLAVEDLAPAWLHGHAAEHEVLASGEAVAPATVFVQIRGERVDLGLEFAGSVMARDRALLLLDDLDQLIAEALTHDQQRSAVHGLPSETASVLRGAPAPDDASLVGAMLAHAASNGEAVAARSGTSTLTWNALDRRSIVLAEQMRLNGVGVGDRVVVSLGRSVDLIVAVVAVLRSGAVYVPVDPDYPPDRRNLILQAADPALAIVEPGAELAWLPCLTVAADRAGSVSFTDHTPQVDDPAYVIFTSGSTGVPKGVEVRHGQLATSTRARDGVYEGQPERFLLLSSIGFDSSLVGLFWTLLAGGEIVIPTEAEAHDPDALLGLIDRCRVSHVLTVPSLYRALLSRGAAADHWPAVAIVAGEACSSELVAAHHERRPDAQLWNEYGPTEGTVWATVHRCVAGEDPVPIGRPIPGAWCAVVDTNGHPVPVGAAGELLIGGAGVVRSYLATRDAGTSSADQSPFIEQPTLGAGYRTGDSAAVGVDGAGERVLWFLGRVDDQLNVGGVRLEPGEIERVLGMVDGVTDSAVVASTSATGRTVLSAHVEGPNIDLGALRAAASAGLPAAARPAAYTIHAQLPRTAHGKVDRAALAALPVPDGVTPSQASDQGSMTGLENRVVELFRRSTRSEMGLDDGFFDAGGDSLAALTLAVDLEDAFGSSFSVTKLLADPSPRAVAAHFASLKTPDGDAVSGDPPPTLVEWIRPGDDQRPVLVLLAPGSGHLLGYEPLIRALDPTVPIVGVRLPGYDGKGTPMSSISELAQTIGPLLDDLVDERTAAVGAQGVVLLGGSSGGLLAWELQHRAEKAGRPFDAIVLQDTVHPDWKRAQEAISVVEDLRRRYESGGIVSVVTELYGRGERRFSRWQRKRRSEAQAATSGAELPAVIAQRMFAATTQGLLSYEVPTVASVVLFVAASSTDPDATFERWGQQAGTIHVETFSGDHFGDNGITAAANVDPVAEEIDRLLRSVER